MRPRTTGRRVGLVLASVAAVMAFAAGWLSAAASRAGDRIGDIDVNVQPLPSVEGGSGRSYGTTHGYTEFRVHLKNTAQKAHTVQLTYPAEGRGGPVNQGIVATRTVHLTQEQGTSVAFYQPVSETVGMDMEVRVDGTPDAQTISVANVQGYRYESSICPSVLVSRDVPRDFRDYLHAASATRQARMGQRQNMPPPDSALGPGHWSDSGRTAADGSSVTPATGAPAMMASTPGSAPHRPGRRSSATEAEPFTLLRSEVPTSQWSPNWLGYSRFDAILLTEQDVETMSPQVRMAIRRYIECGGAVLIHGRSVPAAFSDNSVPDKDAGYFVGLGYVAASLQGMDAKKDAENRAGNAVDGDAPVLADNERGKEASSREKKGDDWAAAFDKLSQMPLHIYHPNQRPDKLFDLLVAEATIPVRGLFVLVMLFGLGIGPANIWLLTKYKKRIWLWWNVPAISLLTCLMVLGYAMLSEGWTGRGKNTTLTLLDERSHHATTFGYVSFYCPLTPSAGLHFADDTELALLSNQVDWERNYSRVRGRTGGAAKFIDWTNDQHLTSGWVNSRVPAYFQVRKNEDRRERLTIQQNGMEPPTIVNALGADIHRLYLADASGRLFETNDVFAGARQTLVPGVGGRLAAGTGLPYLRNIYTGGDWINVFNSWRDIQDASAMLAPGSYIAFLSKSPFVEAPLAGVTSEDTMAIVYGICKEQEDGR